MKRKWFFVFGPLAVVGFLAFIALGGLVVERLWNWLLPPLFGWRAITFWQSVGLLALSRILFGGFGGGGRGLGFRRQMRDRYFDKMTPEERARFREGMRARCGFGSAPSPTTGDAPRPADQPFQS
jgi:hypothetical protein